jgi:DeoR/GlpR family transcriptional regulator of sugar metabolism
MRSNSILPAQRRERILALLKRAEGLRTVEIADALRISPVTVRRDLQLLEDRGLVARAHGGAIMKPADAGWEPPFALKAERMVPEKDRIARRASDLVRDGGTVILDSGTTSLAMARCLTGRRLTVIALDAPVAETLAAREGVNVLMPGGRVRNGLFSIVGPWAEETLRDIHADQFFLAADAVDLDGVTNATVEEVEVKRLAMRAARETVLLADHTKFGAGLRAGGALAHHHGSRHRPARAGAEGAAWQRRRGLGRIPTARVQRRSAAVRSDCDHW